PRSGSRRISPARWAAISLPIRSSRLLKKPPAARCGVESRLEMLTYSRVRCAFEPAFALHRIRRRLFQQPASVLSQKFADKSVECLRVFRQRTLTTRRALDSRYRSQDTRGWRSPAAGLSDACRDGSVSE